MPACLCSRSCLSVLFVRRSPCSFALVVSRPPSSRVVCLWVSFVVSFVVHPCGLFVRSLVRSVDFVYSSFAYVLSPFVSCVACLFCVSPFSCLFCLSALSFSALLACVVPFFLSDEFRRSMC